MSIYKSFATLAQPKKKGTRKFSESPNPKTTQTLKSNPPPPPIHCCSPPLAQNGFEQPENPEAPNLLSPKH